MNETFPASADEFYRRRDHRTNQYRDVDVRYATRTVQVTAEPACLASLSGQVMLLVTCNLLARWCRRVSIQTKDVPAHERLRAEGALIDHILVTMRDADPFGEFTSERLATVDLHVHLGDEPPQLNARATVLTCAGWFAGVRRTGNPGLRMRPSDNPIGGACAAVIGGAQLFRDALGRNEIYPPGFTFDALTGRAVLGEVMHMELLPADLEIGHTLVTGSGSVSSSALFFADLFGIRASLDLVDADIVKVENFGRSPIFGKKGVGSKKVRVVAEALARGSLHIKEVPLWWHESGLSPALMGYDLVLPLANDYDVRMDLQNRVPPLMIHASTGRNWNVNFGRHVPTQDDCLADRFEGLHSKPTFGCSEGQIEIAPGNSIDAALPFLSFFAGLQIAIDLVRLSLPDYPQTPNYGHYSFRGTRFEPQLQDIGPRTSCLCTTQSELFWKLRSATRYAHFSAQGRH